MSKESLLAINLVCRYALGCSFVMGSTYLIANNFDHGWGWMIFGSFLSFCNVKWKSTK